MNYLNKIFLWFLLSIVTSSTFGQQVMHVTTSSNSVWSKVDLSSLNVKILDDNGSTCIKSDSLIELIIFSPRTDSRLKFEIDGSSFSINIDTLNMTINVRQKLRDESEIICEVGYVNDSLEEWLFRLSLFDRSEIVNGKQCFLDCCETGSGLMPTGWNPKLE